MKLTTLGCWGAYPYQDGGTTSYLLTGKDGFQLLIDAGSRALNELEKEISPLELDAVIISHYHPDHVADLGVLRHHNLYFLVNLMKKVRQAILDDNLLEFREDFVERYGYNSNKRNF